MCEEGANLRGGRTLKHADAYVRSPTHVHPTDIGSDVMDVRWFRGRRFSFKYIAKLRSRRKDAFNAPDSKHLRRFSRKNRRMLLCCEHYEMGICVHNDKCGGIRRLRAWLNGTG